MKKSVIVTNAYSSHENPAAELVQNACVYSSNIVFHCGNAIVNVKSIMGVMALNLVEGMEVVIEATGVDEEKAIEAMEEFIAK
ncbi:phosphocarrier protein [Lachnospiraceae bacterium C7]|nr:phosphocarrier protein [Lachnospiraceae bacterium C7]